MEVVVVGAFFNTFLPKLWDVIDGEHLRRYKIKKHIEFMRDELPIMAASIRDHELQCIGRPRSEGSQETIEKARRLAQKTDDCICRFLLYQSGGVRRIDKRMTHQQFGVDIEELRDELVKIKDEVAGLKSTTSPVEPQAHIKEHQFVGMGVPIEELVELLGCVNTNIGKGMLKVISIVGIGGSGKTRLAEQVLQKAGNQFGRHALVRMGPESDVKKVLPEIQKVLEHDHNNPSTSTGIHHPKERYLIVIDDVRRIEDWNFIKNALPDSDVGSRIIVTTTSQSVAEHCSSHNGHVYKMSTLSYEDSEKLFTNAIGKELSEPQKNGLSTLLKICDGLPLAVIESAESLKRKVAVQGACQEAIRKLSTPEGTLTRMQWVLLREYSGLASYGARACLLYFHMFPSEIPNKSKFLTRRWLAEGLVQRDDPKGTDLGAALKYLRTFRDGNIIRSMEEGNNGTVKSCRLTGTMHEFISRQSMSQDFISFLANVDELDKQKADRIRRLSLHDGAAESQKCIDGVDVSLLRTLAVSGEACTPVMDFSRYELLLVLDLKKWDYHRLDTVKKLQDKLQKKLKDICKLVRLKYLGLPGSIREIPRLIKHLKCLETLDVEETEIVEVYGEVINLPKLKHLLGMFRLSTHESPERWVPEDSRLETFSGFVTNEKAAFPKLMKDMKQLRKVKIWCNSKAKEKEVMEHLPIAIKEFIDGKYRCLNRSLSIDVKECSDIQFLQSLDSGGCLTKLKLKGSLEELPKFITQLEGVTSLCLSLTTQSKKFLATLDPNIKTFTSLTYLKLVENELGPLKILENNFPGLERLCLVSNTSLNCITIETGALKFLVSLHIMCKAQVGLAGIQIGGLESLEEIALDSEDPSTRSAWKEAANGHPNMPRVLFM